MGEGGRLFEGGDFFKIFLSKGGGAIIPGRPLIERRLIRGNMVFYITWKSQ